MREHAEEYLTMRQALGYRLKGQGRLLLDFAGHDCDTYLTVTATGSGGGVSAAAMTVGGDTDSAGAARGPV